MSSGLMPMPVSWISKHFFLAKILKREADRSVIGRVLQGIGDDLVNDKSKPFAITVNKLFVLPQW